MVEGQERMVHAEETVQNIVDLSVGISSPYPSTGSFSLVELVETSFSLGGETHENTQSTAWIKVTVQ